MKSTLYNSFCVFDVVNEWNNVVENSIKMELVCGGRAYVCCPFQDARDAVGFP